MTLFYSIIPPLRYLSCHRPAADFELDIGADTIFHKFAMSLDRDVLLRDRDDICR